MRIRKARKSDFARIIPLAKNLGLDYSRMEDDDFWVAEENHQVEGIVGLKKHKDCQELYSLGVSETYRNRSIGKKLIQAILQNTRQDVYVATISPEYFYKLGFERASRIPPSLIKSPDWCSGCQKELCAVLVKKSE